MIAGAGTGKTRVLTLRVVHLVNKYHLAPCKVLIITFTDKATEELRLRIQKIIPDADFGWINTIHSFCNKFLHKEINKLERNGDYKLFNEELKQKAICKILEERNLNKEVLNSQELSRAISLQKNMKVSAEIAIRCLDSKINCYQKAVEILKIVSSAYEETLNVNNQIDFDDLLILTKKILVNFPEVKEEWQKFFDYIFVDEFQDIDSIQYDIICLLAQKKHHLFVVGDPDQLIYSWRWAVPNIGQKLSKDFPGTKTLLLTQNYRSTHDILKVSNALIKNDPHRIKKKLFTKRRKSNPVVHYHATSRKNEAEWIADKIKELVIIKKVFRFGEIAILYRKKFWGEEIVPELTKRNFFYTTEKNFNFYQISEIQKVLNYMKLAILNDGESVVNIIKSFHTDEFNKNLDKNIKKAVKQYSCSTFDILTKYQTLLELTSADCENIDQLLNQLNSVKTEVQLHPERSVEAVIKAFGLDRVFNKDNWTQNAKNFNFLSYTISEFLKENPKKRLEDFLKQIDSDDDKNLPIIRLMTIHDSKGLEFPCVFVAGLVNGVLPDGRTLSPKSNKFSNHGGYEEERRLLYVAMTRAMDQLYLTSCGGKNTWNNKNFVPSPFLNEIPSSFLKKINAQSSSDSTKNNSCKMKHLPAEKRAQPKKFSFYRRYSWIIWLTIIVTIILILVFLI